MISLLPRFTQPLNTYQSNQLASFSLNPSHSDTHHPISESAVLVVPTAATNLCEVDFLLFIYLFIYLIFYILFILYAILPSYFDVN